MPSIILYEDNHLLVINKPVSMLSQMDRTGDKSAIELCADYIKVKYNKPGEVYIRAVHRIDRPVSGCLILTKTSKATERMLKIIHDRKIKKLYHAITAVKPSQSSARLVNHLVKDTFRNKVRVYDQPVEKSKEAILNYELVSQNNQYYLLKIDLETGRPHQIRAQLSNQGMPILGDNKYKDRNRMDDKSICLHSYSIEFTHPVTKENFYLEAPYPKTKYWKMFKA